MDYRNIKILALQACTDVYKLAMTANLTDTESRMYESLIIQEMSTALAKSLHTAEDNVEE